MNIKLISHAQCIVIMEFKKIRMGVQKFVKLAKYRFYRDIKSINEIIKV